MSQKKKRPLALITGGSGGIGYAIAKLLYREGYHLVLTGRKEEKLKQAAMGLCRENGGRIETVVCDLSNTEECERLHGLYQNRPVEVLINCAGFGVYGEFGKTDLNGELDMLHVNCRALHILMKLFLQDMDRRGCGAILNVASTAGLTPGGPLMSAYYATKSYVVSLTCGVAEELRAAGSPVYVGVLCPGPVDTSFFDRADIGAAVKGMSADTVARAAISGMKQKKRIIVPGCQNRLVCMAAKFLPAAWILPMNHRIQAKKKKGEGQ